MIRTFRQGSSAVTVDADAETVTWLEEFLSPSFSVIDADTSGVRVTLLDGAPPTTVTDERREVVAFAFDTGPRHLRAAPTTEGRRLFDELGSAEFDVSTDGRRVVVWTQGDRLRARVRLMRVVREYAHNRALANGGLILHGAAVVVAGRAVVFAGPKGAGKTTAALDRLGPDVQYLANDRVLVQGTGAPQAIGVPTVLAFREGSRRVLWALAASLASAGDFRETAAVRRSHGPRTPLTFGDAWHLSAPQLVDGCASSVSASAPLDTLVVLDGPPDTSIQELGGADAADAVCGALLGVRGAHTSDVFVEPSTRRATDAALECACHALARHVRCLRAPARQWTPHIREWLGR